MNESAISGVPSASDARVAGVEYHPPPNASSHRRQPQNLGVSRNPAPDAGAIPPKASAQLLSCRIDALTVAFREELPPSTSMQLEARAEIARLTGAVELSLGGFTFELKPNRRQGFHPFANADIRGVFDEQGAGGWNLEIILRATYLATHDLETVLSLPKRIADAFGKVSGPARVRRFDCAADFVGFDLASIDPDALLTKRSKIAEFRSESKDIDELETGLQKPELRLQRGSNSKVQGFSVSSGNPISGRIYDKTAELNVPGREEKRAIEHEIWKRAGWDGSSSVTRVEFQHRGPFLDEVNVRDLDLLPSMLDAVWQHDVHWLRIVYPKQRADAADATSILDGRACKPSASRIRRHRPLVCGNVAVQLSRMYSAPRSHESWAAGRFPRIDPPETNAGEVLEGVRLAGMTSEADAEGWCQAYLNLLFERVANDTAAYLAVRFGWKNAMVRLLARHNPANARFSSEDDRQTGSGE